MTIRSAYLFDSHALLKFFQAEAGYEKVLRLLHKLQKTDATKYLSAINLGEIIYATKRQFGDQKKIEVLAHIERLNFNVLPVPNSLIFQASEYKADFSISYADCFALASAVEHKAAVVTGDPEFKKVAHLVEVVWV